MVMNNIWFKNKNINVISMLIVYTFLLIGVLYLFPIKVYAGTFDDNPETIDTGITNKSSFDWTLFVPDADQIRYQVPLQNC